MVVGTSSPGDLRDLFGLLKCLCFSLVEHWKEAFPRSYLPYSPHFVLYLYLTYLIELVSPCLMSELVRSALHCTRCLISS